MSEILVPPDGALVAVFTPDWNLYRMPQPAKGSKLWVELKLIARGAPRKFGVKRVYRLCWGVDAQRFRRDAGAYTLQSEIPKLYEGVDLVCRKRFTPAALELEMGAAALAAERARIAKKPVKPARKSGPAVDIFS